jgi:hypothetical protein
MDLLMIDENEKLKTLVGVITQQRNQVMDALAQAVSDVQLLQNKVMKLTDTSQFLTEKEEEVRSNEHDIRS